MAKTIKLIWRILIIVLLNLFIISLVNYINVSATGKEQANPPPFINIFNKKNTIKAQTRADKTGQYGNADFTLLAKVISAEARSEPYEGQVAVGAVILNRVEHPSFPDTIAGVVYQPDAFTCMYDGNIDQEVVESAYRAAQDAING